MGALWVFMFRHQPTKTKLIDSMFCDFWELPSRLEKEHRNKNRSPLKSFQGPTAGLWRVKPGRSLGSLCAMDSAFTKGMSLPCSFELINRTDFTAKLSVLCSLFTSWDLLDNLISFC